MEDGLYLDSVGEVAVLSGNNLTIDGTTFTLDELPIIKYVPAITHLNYCTYLGPE